MKARRLQQRIRCAGRAGRRQRRAKKSAAPQSQTGLASALVGMRAPQSSALRKVYKHRRSTALAKWRFPCRVGVRHLESMFGFRVGESPWLDTAGVNGQKYA